MWEELHLLKDIPINISTNNQKCKRFGIYSQLMRQEFYNGTKSVYAANKSVLFNLLYILKRDDPTLYP